jgi:hypothetical protein
MIFFPYCPGVVDPKATLYPSQAPKIAATALNFVFQKGREGTGLDDRCPVSPLRKPPIA